MGEIAEDCYDRALDELMDMDYGDYDRGPFVNDAEPRMYRQRIPFRRRQPSATPDDFDALE